MHRTIWSLVLLAAVMAGAGRASAADCPVPAAAGGEAKMMPMPDMKMDDPMPTGMAPDSTPKGDVTEAAAKAKACMDMMLRKEEQEIPVK